MEVIFFVVAVIAFFLFKQFLTSYSKTKKYYNISIDLLILGCLIIFAVGIIYLNNNLNKYSSSEVVADGFKIDSYNVKIDVTENNIVYVTETIDINFYESGHHGIYRFVPNWLEYTPRDGNTISRKSKIIDLQAIGDEYSLDKINGKNRIKIGSPDFTLPIGSKKYTITYQYDMGNDPYKDFDEFIFHAFGDYWGTSINDATIEITMPKNIDDNVIRFFADKYRNNDVTSYINYYVTGNKLYANVSPSLNLTKSLTVDIELPEGYFTNENSNYGYASMILCLIVISISVIAFIKWIKYGKDNDKYSETVEFYSPEGYDPAEIGYIYKKDSGRKLTISIIVELASKGYIKIDESDDKKVRTITNLCPVDIDKEINRKIMITKLKDATKKEDIEVMNSLFVNNSSNSVVTEKFDEFYNNTANLVANKIIKIDSDSINDYSSEELNKILDNVREKEYASKPDLTSNEKLVYNQLFLHSNTNILSDDKEFYKVFSQITDNLQNELDDKINDVNSYKNMMISSLMFLIGTICFAFAFTILEDLNPKYQILYFIDFVSLIITFIFIIIMKRKNTYGEQIMAKIKGFKNYLETAEKDQIDKLVNDNPNYFYDILPYAYVLGVSKVWIDKFENIPNPQNDMGNFDYCNMDSFNSLSDSVHIPSSSGSSSGGCSSCGGGCSSCGGGGSW